MNAERLIDSYLAEQEGEKRDPDSRKFIDRLIKGQPVKPDKVHDLPFRDHAVFDPADTTWRSSSTAPYR